MDKARFPELLHAIYASVDALEDMFPGRHFTPDGHLVGSLGEALASYHYGIELSCASAQRHDGTCGGRNVQIKTTQGNRVAISSEPEHLLVLRLQRDGNFVEEYNGPGSLVWSLVSCRVPDDCVDSRRYPLFMARDVMRGLIEQLKGEGVTKS